MVSLIPKEDNFKASVDSEMLRGQLRIENWT